MHTCIRMHAAGNSEEKQKRRVVLFIREYILYNIRVCVWNKKRTKISLSELNGSAFNCVTVWSQF